MELIKFTNISNIIPPFSEELLKIWEIFHPLALYQEHKVTTNRLLVSGIFSKSFFFPEFFQILVQFYVYQVLMVIVPQTKTCLSIKKFLFALFHAYSNLIPF